ncbi:MAG TPA: D-alanine--D-alanine ligase family protein [Pyrinomonadaceae bacterium]|nr:D-alanine--D-alanine ligase family protein [Pyrinomonadaceae bacterium]
MKRTLVVIFGGRSGEHEISIRSARTVIQQADREKYDVVPVMISEDGVWKSPEESWGAFGNPEDDRQASGDPGSGLLGLIAGILDGNEAKTGRGPSSSVVVFPVLHGTFGEDGTIQGLLEMADVPYVGCGVLASSCGMDKVFMKTLFRDAGLPQCDYVWFLRDEWERAREATVTRVAAKLRYPCFVKPANLGSSVGVSRAVDDDSLANAIDLAAEYDRKIIVEEGLDMREIECAVMGNDAPEASLPGEYIIRDSSKAFLDYTEKYSGTGNNEFVVPSPISDELTVRVRSMAVKAFKAVDGSGLARVDFFLRSDNGALLINEINTMPGLTDASGWPKMWQGTGKEFSVVIDELVELALRRYEDKKRNRTSK